MIGIASSPVISSVNTVSDSNSSDTFKVVTLGSTIHTVQFHGPHTYMPHIRIVIVVPSTIIKLQLLVNLQSKKFRIVKMRTILMKMDIFVPLTIEQILVKLKSFLST